ncbi:MAG: metalloregulator ArsR/SmtB family transcription factor [Candidatus Dechloromonas phosphoritropha]
MNTLIGAEIFAALGHESRLAIFRLLIEAGPGSINAAAIGEKPGIPNAALSSHLSHLSRVGLIKGERESRSIHYSAGYTTMDELNSFLTQNSYQGDQYLPKTQAAATTGKRQAKVEA